MQNLIQNDHLQRSCPAQHQSCSERKFAKSLSPKFANFHRLSRNNNLQIRFTEPHYEKKFQNNSLQKTFPHRQFAKKKSCIQDNDNEKQIAKKLSGRTICKQVVWNNKDIHNDNFKKYMHMVHNVCSVRANEFELFPADVQFADSAFIIWVSR